MREKNKKLLKKLFAGVFVISGLLVGLSLYDYRLSAKLNQEAQQLAFSSSAVIASQEQYYESHVIAPAETMIAIEAEFVDENIPLAPAPSEERTQAMTEQKPQEITKEPAEEALTLIEQTEAVVEQAEVVAEQTESVVEQTPEVPQNEDIQLMMSLELQKLQETNARVFGWIRIPDTPVDYPLIRVRDNNEYLRRAWDGSYSYSGCIFLECRNDVGLGDFNTLIYGHKMGQGKMFGSLQNYQKQEYADEHPYIYIATEDAVKRYEIFAAYEAEVVSDTYRLIFENDEQKEKALQHYLESSVIESEHIPSAKDNILTLSTCIGTGITAQRWVVQAVLTEILLRK